MTIYATVTNSGDGVVGRGGYRFDPGKSTDIEISATQFTEVYKHPNLNVTVTGADSPAEIHAVEDAGIDIKLEATDAARKLADERGIDVFDLTGSGKSGRVTVDDVKKVGVGSTARQRDFIPKGTHQATTLDPPSEQQKAQAKTREQWEQEQVIGVQEGERPPAGEQAIGEPSGPSQAGEAPGAPAQWRGDAPRQDSPEESAPSAERSQEAEREAPAQ